MRKLPLIAVILLVFLAGCSASGPTGSDIQPTVAADQTVIVGTEYPVDVTLENAGSESGDYTAFLAVDGETVDSAGTTVAPDESPTLSLTHTFDSSGEYTVTAAGTTYTVTVVDPQAVLDNHAAVESYAMSESLTIEPDADDNTSTYSVTTHSTYDLAAEEMAIESHVSQNEQTNSVYGWYMGGVAYQQFGDNDPTYDSTEQPWAEVSQTVAPETYLDTLSSASVEYGGGATIYSADLEDETVVEDVLGLLEADHQTVPDQRLPDADDLITFDSEVIVDDGYITRVDLHLVAEETDENGESTTSTLTMTRTYEAYNEEPGITVPADVRSGASE